MLNDKIVLVTGGTGFLGKAVVAAYLNAGAHVWVNYRSEEKFQQLQQAVGTDRLHGIAADLATETEVQALFAELSSRSGRLDVLAHLVGGFWMGGELADTPVAAMHQMMQMNFLTTFLVTREAFRLMKRQGGVIFTIASKTAVEFPAGMGAYSISKAAVLALTQTLASEGKAYGIRANAILPGIIDTPANRQAMPDADTSQWTSPQEIAQTLVALSTSATAVNGSLLKMYGRL